MSTFLYILIAMSLLLVLYMWSEAFRNRIRTHTFSFHHLPSSFHNYRLFFISDVHRRQIPLHVIKKLKGKVDFVMIGGDFCERGVPYSRIEKNLSRLSALGPTFFVWGNNDEEVGKEELKELLQKWNVTELLNQVQLVERNEEYIVIGGVDDLGHGRDQVDKVIAKCGTSFSILVSHYPEIVQRLPSAHPFSLVLSGHTHGGQIRLLGWGLREKGRVVEHAAFSHLISNGYGTTWLPLRLGAPSEMHLICLRKG